MTVVISAIGLTRRSLVTVTALCRKTRRPWCRLFCEPAALIDLRTVWAMCLAAACSPHFVGALCGAGWRPCVFHPASGLFWGAGGQRGLAGHLSNLARNQSRHQTHVGCRLRNERNKWLWLLPACARWRLLPRPREHGESPMQRRWFPAGLFFLWLAGTGVHLYCLGYVYDFDLRREC